MARIAGVDLPRDKRVEIGLTYIYGIGRKTANDILAGTVSKDLPIQVDANGEELLITNGMAPLEART